MDYQKLRRYLEAPPKERVFRRGGLTNFMQQCPEWASAAQIPTSEKVLSSFIDPIKQTQAAILSLSLFMQRLTNLPSDYLVAFTSDDHPEDWQHEPYPLDWVLRDLRGQADQYEDTEGFKRRGEATANQFLDAHLREALLDNTVALVASLGFEEFGYVTGNETLLNEPELAVLGIDSLIGAIAAIRDGEPTEAVLKWNQMAVEAFAWSWEFLNAPLGGSRLSHLTQSYDLDRIHLKLLEHEHLYYFQDEEDFNTFWDDPEQAAAFISYEGWREPGWYDVYEGELKMRELPIYLALEQISEQPIYYQEFYKRWVELVDCRWPVARWKSNS